MLTVSTVHSHASRGAPDARLALRCLHAELVLYPKPGLVSLVDNGSHHDMTALTFVRSLGALRHYFRDMLVAGRAQAPFHTLQAIAIAAEQRMLRATRGINTHRGAIFSLGMLSAARGACLRTPTPAELRAHLLALWGPALQAHAGMLHGESHGLQVAARHGVGGAREEAALGLPAVFEHALPRLRTRLAEGASMREAQIDALFVLIAHLSDTNVYYRGGALAAEALRQQAKAFIDAGGTRQPDWEQQAVALHHDCVRRRLSPGGAADLLAATLFVHGACR